MKLKEIVQPLLDWYTVHARVLPWRDEPTPYRVLVSELMLQQTRVQTALPYFERFVRELPDIESLAEADESTLFKLWEGLGYYSRARNLQKAAQNIVRDHGGVVPRTFEE
ncbi:MAG: A/G-specific adenine glycosylase, partial [Eubacteriales bacterium]